MFIWLLGCLLPTRGQADDYGCALYPSVEDVLKDDSVDAVYVLTNMESHCDLAVKAMDAGKPVYIEKPVASSVAELRIIEECAKANGVACMLGHNYIYEPGVHRIKTMIDDGALGDVSAHVLGFVSEKQKETSVG